MKHSHSLGNRDNPGGGPLPFAYGPGEKIPDEHDVIVDNKIIGRAPTETLRESIKTEYESAISGGGGG